MRTMRAACLACLACLTCSKTWTCQAVYFRARVQMQAQAQVHVPLLFLYFFAQLVCDLHWCAVAAAVLAAMSCQRLALHTVQSAYAHVL